MNGTITKAVPLSVILSLAVLAEIAEMNYYHFARLFKHRIGLSPHRYILEQGIERAEQFLASPQMTVRQQLKKLLDIFNY